MCGIAGIYGYGDKSHPVTRDELLSIRDTMVTRGPDAAGLWLSPNANVGLAHRRLSIIDLTESGAQPMVTADGKLRVVFNGEIYNYRKLRRELEQRGYRFHSHSDTEVLLHLYADCGTEMTNRLRGMYAFAIWDEHKQGMFFARDPFGVKPLYVADDGATVRFASQVKALRRSSNVNTDAEPAGHVGFFLWGSVPEPYTLYRGIRALRAGCSLWVDRRGVRQPQEYFRIGEEFARLTDVVTARTIAEQDEQIRAALQDSVDHHLVADVPVGMFLSAGLDSTTLAALASQKLAQRLHTVTLGFREYQSTVNDETPLAARAAQALGTRHDTCWVKRSDFSAEYDRLMQAMDQPTIDGVNVYFVSKVAKQAGLKVAMSGLGGDELLRGYPSFREIPGIVSALAPLRPLSGMGKWLRWISAPLLKHFTSPKYAGVLEYGTSWSGAYLLRRGLFMPWELPQLLDSEMVRVGWQELQPLVRMEKVVNRIRSDTMKVAALEMSMYMNNQLLRDADWAGMAHSIEIRVPFVDVELYRTLQPIVAQRAKASKSEFLKPVVSGLPGELFERPKTGFSIPVREWLADGFVQTTDRGLRGWARHVYDHATRR